MVDAKTTFAALSATATVSSGGFRRLAWQQNIRICTGIYGGDGTRTRERHRIAIRA
jgi:hypothetical protein